MPKYIVKAPVSIRVCVEVRARSKAQAKIRADDLIQELEKLYNGIGGHDLNRPPMLGAQDEGWFEDDDACGFFLEKDVEVTRA